MVSGKFQRVARGGGVAFTRLQCSRGAPVPGRSDVKPPNAFASIPRLATLDVAAPEDGRTPVQGPIEHPVLEVAAPHEPAMRGAAFMPLQLSMAPALAALKRRERRAPVHGPNVHPILEVVAFHEPDSAAGFQPARIGQAGSLPHYNAGSREEFPGYDIYLMAAVSRGW